MTLRPLIAALCLLCSTLAHAQRGTPIMQFSGGHSGTSGLGLNANGANGYAAFVQDEKLFGRYFRGGLWPRILFKNPGGAWLNRPDKPSSPGYAMWPDQIPYGQSLNAPFTREYDLAYIHAWWFANGVEEVIDYIGRPDLLDDPLVDGRRCVEALLASGSKVSICVDAGSEISKSGTWKLKRTIEFFREIRASDHKVYIEAIPAVGEDIWRDEIDGVYCLKRFADSHPDRLKYALEGGFGDIEVIVGTNDNQAVNDNVELIQKFPNGATRAARRYWLFGDYTLENLAK